MCSLGPEEIRGLSFFKDRALQKLNELFLIWLWIRLKLKGFDYQLVDFE